MSTITIPQPELTTEEVSAALRKGLGPRYQVLPGRRTSILPGAPDPGWPDSIVVGPGAPMSSGFSSRSTTAAAGPASGWRRAACRRSGW